MMQDPDLTESDEEEIKQQQVTRRAPFKIVDLAQDFLAFLPHYGHFDSYREMMTHFLVFLKLFSSNPPRNQHEEKAIVKRRVYDVLNILEPIGIITKKRKTIDLVGVPNVINNVFSSLKTERDSTIERIEKKQRLLKELCVQTVCIGNQYAHGLYTPIVKAEDLSKFVPQELIGLYAFPCEDQELLKSILPS